MALIPSNEATPGEGSPWRRRTRRWLLPILYASAALGLLAFTFSGSLRLIGTGFPGFLVWDNGALVSLQLPTWSSSNVGLPHNGGVITSVDGRAFAGGRAFLDHASALEPGTPVRYVVRAGGSEQEYVVPTMRFGLADLLATFGIYAFVAASLFAVGTLALLLRSDHPVARGLALAAGVTGAMLALVIDFLSSFRVGPACQLAEALAPAAVANLAAVFPVPRLDDRMRRALVGGFGLALLAVGLFAVSEFYSRPELNHRIILALYALIAVCLAGMAVNLALVAFRGAESERRTQAAVVLAGALPASALHGLALFSFAVLGWSVSAAWSALLVPLIPAALLYAVVRHDLLEAERFIRLTVGYTLATVTVFLAYAGALVLMGRLVRLELSAATAASAALLAAVALCFEPVRRRVQRGVDRAFFRIRIDVARTLEGASHELAGLSDEAAIRESVKKRLEADMGADWVELCSGPEAPAAAQIIEPVTSGAERLAVLAIGPKRSGAPFSEEERRLVRGVADQAAVALHDARGRRALEEAERELLRSTRLATIGEFSAAVAHGLRNPLAAIRASMEIAQDRARAGEVALPIEGTVEEIDRLDRRIRGLLEFARPYEPKPQPVDLRTVLREVCNALEARAQRQEVEIEMKAPPTAVQRLVDADMLEDVLLELGTNALRAMPSGGRLVLALEPSRDAVEITVSDTGHGIPDAARDRIFDIFYTTRSEGTGMGLATVKKLVELQGGAVWLERSQPEGTTFRLRLPEPVRA